MRTTMPKVGELNRKWYILDAADKPLGHTAAAAAHILRGKHRADYAPHIDCGDHVIIINAEKAVLTGKKAEQKFYRHHSGWMGGLKEIRYDRLMKEAPEKAVMVAVKGMLPNNTVGRKSLTRCRIYRDADHNQQAQQPEVWEF